MKAEVKTQREQLETPKRFDSLSTTTGFTAMGQTAKNNEQMSDDEKDLEENVYIET